MNTLFEIPDPVRVELVISNETAAKLLIILFIFFLVIAGAVVWGRKIL
jgi:hypothetical protein